MTAVFVHSDVSHPLCQYISTISKQSIEKHGKFLVAISGGSLPTQLRPLINDTSIDWASWHVFFTDERCVPLAHTDSNYRLVRHELLAHVPIPQDQVHTIDPALVDSPDEAAEAYMDQMLRVFASRNTVRFPVFDLILLGLGPDGHTCSLFPGHKLLSETVEWVAGLVDSPKPPSARITLTLPVLNHAHNVAFVCTGVGKQGALHKILDLHDKHLPGTLVHPVHGVVTWFLDDHAAESVTSVVKQQYKM